MKLSYKIVTFTVITFMSIGTGLCRYYAGHYSLDSAFDLYGFSQQHQKEALKSLLQQASVTLGDGTLDESFGRTVSQEQLARTIIEMVAKTQQKFFLRTGGKERWEIEGLPWMQQNKEQTLADLKPLGFIDAKVPQGKTFDALCIFGATKSRIKDRIRYAASFIEQGGKAAKVILLGGERYVTAGADIDGTEEELQALAITNNLTDWHKLTETLVMKDAYDHSELKKYGLEMSLINTLRGDLPRPTTQTTLMALIEWLQQHPDIKRILFFSNQPYVSYQKALVEAIFKEQNIAIEYEVVGSAMTRLDDVHAALEGLGSYLWAATPMTLKKLTITIDQEDLKKQLESLYAKTPLLYQTIPFA